MKNCPYDEYYMSGLYNQMIAAGRTQGTGIRYGYFPLIRHT